MKKLIYILSAMLFSLPALAQDNGLAVQSYGDAQKAFDDGKYEAAISNLNIAETMLKSTNPKIERLKLKSYKHLALTDSVKSYDKYAAYVKELASKKSTVSNDASAELKTFSQERKIFLENKKNSLIEPLDGLRIGQDFTAIQKESHGMIDFEKPIDENGVLRYVRKTSTPEKETGLYEIVVAKSDGRIVKLTSIIRFLNLEKLQDINNIYKEKLKRFDAKSISSANVVEKFGKKEYNKGASQVKIDNATTYSLNIYTPTKIKAKDIKNGETSYFLTESYEIR